MADLTCPKCGGPAVRVEQTGKLSCVQQCQETSVDELRRKQLEGFTADLARLVGAHMPNDYVFTLIVASAPADTGGGGGGYDIPFVQNMTLSQEWWRP